MQDEEGGTLTLERRLEKDRNLMRGFLRAEL